jgi:hypothetical protein
VVRADGEAADRSGVLLGRRPHRRAVEQKAAHPPSAPPVTTLCRRAESASIGVRGDLMLAARMLRSSTRHRPTSPSRSTTSSRPGSAGSN